MVAVQVMGGQSSGNFSVVEQGSESYGLFQGTVRNVSFLHAPGFCRFTTVFPGGKHENAAEFLEGGLKITLRERRGEHHRGPGGHGEQYQGFKVAVSSPGASHHHGGHELFGMYKVRRNASALVLTSLAALLGTNRVPRCTSDRRTSPWRAARTAATAGWT